MHAVVNVALFSALATIVAAGVTAIVNGPILVVVAFFLLCVQFGLLVLIAVNTGR